MCVKMTGERKYERKKRKEKRKRTDENKACSPD
jgi:hypothetical protein